MSRIGKKIIQIPSNVNIVLKNNIIEVEGPFGKLEKSFLDYVTFDISKTELKINRVDDTKKIKSYHGLCRSLIQNMILGVSQLFKKVLLLEGVGYKFQIQDGSLILNIGFTHTIKIIIPKELKIKLESPTKLVIESYDKEFLGLYAAKIRSIKPPEPYKGKGIFYENEKIKRKVGKK